MKLKEELRDYIIALDNAKSSIHKDSNYKKFDSAERNLLDQEVKTLEVVLRDLRVILEQEEGTYWNFLNIDDEIC